MEKQGDAQRGSSSEDQRIDIHRIKQLKTQQHKQMGNAEFLRYLKSHPGLDNTVLDLERLWHSASIPEFYSAGLLWTLKLHDLDVILERLREQFELTRLGRSRYHRILESIRCRHICMEKIGTQLGAIYNLNILMMFRRKYTRDSVMDKLAEEAKAQGYSNVTVRADPELGLSMLKDLFTDMCRLRELTVYTVELIHEWRFEVEQAMESCNNLQPVHFFLQGKNYYEQLRVDTNFIWNSQLSLYIFFEYDCDIFLVRNILGVEKREEKELLEQYFLEILYPKDDKIFDRTVEAMEYLSYQTPVNKKSNQYELEELLVENYIRMDYSPSKLQEEKLKQQELERRLYIKEAAKDELKSSSLSVYKKKPVIQLKAIPKKLELQRRLGDKLTRLNKAIEDELNTIRVKPFTILNYAAKNSLDLKIKKEHEADELVPFEPFKKVIEEHERQGKQQQPEPLQQTIPLHQTTGFRASVPKIEASGLKTSPARKKMTVKSVLESLEKAGKKRQSKLQGYNRLYGQGRNRSHQNIHYNHSNTSYTFGSPYSPFKAKINTLEKKRNKSLDADAISQHMQTQQDQIEVDEGFSPLNKRIFDVFGTIPVRASMTSVRKSKKRVSVPAQTDRQGKLAKFDDDVRRQNSKANFVIRRNKQIKLELADKPEKLYDDFKKVVPTQQAPSDKRTTIVKDHTQFFVTSLVEGEKPLENKPEEFLRLKPKSLPLDMLQLYLQHLFSIRNPVLTLFTDYQLSTVHKHATEAQKVYVFELLDRQDQAVGQLLVTEHVSKIGLVKYQLEFIHVDRFQFFVRAVLLLTEQVFRFSAAEELVVPLKLDKMDDVSREFIKLIDSKFGQKATILEKSRPSYLGHDIHDRLYVLRRDPSARLQMLSQTYDTRLTVKANAFVFCSNFKLRKMSYMTRHYQSTHRELKLNIQLLYAHCLEKIMTKHHMRLLRLAPDHIKQLLLLLYRTKTIPDYDKVQVSEFKSTADLKNYLEYRSYDAEQRLLQFLEDSKFVMRKELVLAEFAVQLKLDYFVLQTVCRIDNHNHFYVILENHRKHPLEVITSSDFCTEMVMLPCGDTQGYQLLLMQAEQYIGLDIDLYSYLNSFLKTAKRRVQEVIEAVCLPEVIFRHRVTESDTLAEQFPERQFYYSGQVEFRTDRPLPLGIVRQPHSMIFQCPLIVGFYRNNLQVCYLVNKKHMICETYP